MSPSLSGTRRVRIGAIAVFGFALPWSLVHAGRAIEERRPADPQGQVEIVNVAGSVELSGWNRAEVEVSGSAGDNVERVDVNTTGARTSIRVVPRSGGWRNECQASLTIHVPAKSSISASLVSADLQISGIQGDVALQTVSGDVRGEVGGNLHANTVSGNVRLTTHSANAIEIKTISGDIQVSGGGGDVEITTVSGDAKAELATLTRGRFRSISGDVSAVLALGADAQLEGESVSGSIRFDFATMPAADFDVQSFSGAIDSCFGPKATESRYGPGSRLMFKNGDGHARVRVDTKNGDVHLCVKGMPGKRAQAVPPAAPDVRWVAAPTQRRILLPYVL
jgi:DUF4097 and DUF4098 domain-containing protein YvlB